MTYRTAKSLAAVFASTLGLWMAGCATNIVPSNTNTASISETPAPKAAPNPSRTAKIALLLPLAGLGETAQIARGMKQAAEMALFEADDPSVLLLFKDDGGTAEGAVKAAEAAVSEGAEVILGPLFAKSATAAAPVAAKAGIPVLAFSNDPAAAGNNVYLMSFMVADEVQRVISYAAGQGKRRYAALLPATAYGQTADRAFRSAVRDANGEIVAIETYAAVAGGMMDGARKLVAAIKNANEAGQPVDALFLPVAPQEISQIGPLLVSELDPKAIKMIGTSAWDVPAIMHHEAMAGGWYPATDSAGWPEFSAKFQKNFGRPPPRIASLAYDSMRIAIGLSAAPAPSRYTAESLTRVEGFPGVDGQIRLKANGRPERSLAILEIGKYSANVIDPAPALGARQVAESAR